MRPGEGWHRACREVEPERDTDAERRRRAGPPRTEAGVLAPSTQVRETGRQCARFIVTEGGRRVAHREVCVQGRSPEVDVTIEGPEEFAVGEPAEYVVIIVNRSGRDLPDVSVTLVYDPALSLRAASTGAQRSDGRVQWDLETLQAEERVQIETAFECLSEQPAARIAATIQSGAAEVTTRKTIRIKLSRR